MLFLTLRTALLRRQHPLCLELRIDENLAYTIHPRIETVEIAPNDILRASGARGRVDGSRYICFRVHV